MHLFTSRFWGLFAAGALVAATARAQDMPARPAPATGPAAPARSAPTARPQALRPSSVPDAPSDEQSYRKEFVFGVNFNTQGGLLGGASVRSSRVLDGRLLRFWSI